MSADGMDGAVTARGNVQINVGDDEGDYAKLSDHVGLSQVELQRARSTVDLAVPWLVWPVFVVSIVVGSSSAAVMKGMDRAAPVSLAGWRHQVSALVMLPLFILEWRRLPKFDRAKVLSFHTLGLYFISALGLSVHLSFFQWSLDLTSMIHCLFLVSMPPIFVAIYTKLVGGVLLTGEMVGVGLGLVGAGVLATGTNLDQNDQSTYIGDLAALLSAISLAAYLINGKKLLSWMPLFVYQFPVAVLAAFILAAGGLLMEGWNESEVGDISGPFSWIRKEYILGTIFLGIGPGFMGHAGYSFVLRHSSPLVMPAGISSQPIIGSALGWACGESPLPGLWTVLGGTVTLAGTVFVSCASAKKKVGVENNEEEYKQPAIGDEEGQEGAKPLLQPSELP